MKRLFVAGFLSVIFLCSSAIAGLQGIHVAELKNGMKVCVIPDKRLPVVLHTLIYGVGGVDDPVGLSGFAHFFEHLMFSGTKKFADFSGTIDGLGGKFNAFTSNAYTAYYELVGKSHLPLVMEMEADRMHSLNPTQSDIERERKIVLEERKMRTESTPRGLLMEEMVNAFYRNGYGRPVIGWAHEIANYNAESARSFYSEYYNPSNAVLLVTGDVDLEEVLVLARKYYGRIVDSTDSVKRVTMKLEPPHRSDITVKMRSPMVSNAELLLLYGAPSVMNAENLREYCATVLAADIVAGEDFGVLYDELVRRKLLATHISASYDAWERSMGAVFIRVLTKQGVSIDAINTELESIAEGLIKSGVSEELLENSKYRNIASIIYSLDGVESKAWFYANLLATKSFEISADDIIHAIRDVRVEDVNSALKSIFSGARVEGYLLPMEVSNEE